jgi:hypothetical protein
MRSELRPVPLNWQHPTLDGTDIYIPLDPDYPAAVTAWEDEREALVLMRGPAWENAVATHLGANGVPMWTLAEDGEDEILVWVHNPGHLLRLLLEESDRQRPVAADYMPVVDPETTNCSWILYENNVPVLPLHAHRAVLAALHTVVPQQAAESVPA